MGGARVRKVRAAHIKRGKRGGGVFRSTFAEALSLPHQSKLNSNHGDPGVGGNICGHQKKPVIVAKHGTLDSRAADMSTKMPT